MTALDFEWGIILGKSTAGCDEFTFLQKEPSENIIYSLS